MLSILMHTITIDHQHQPEIQSYIPCCLNFIVSLTGSRNHLGDTALGVSVRVFLRCITEEGKAILNTGIPTQGLESQTESKENKKKERWAPACISLLPD